MPDHRWSINRSFAVIISIFLAACGDSGGPSGPDPNDAIASVTVTPSPATVDIGSSIQLTATVRNGRGETMHVAVQWSSSAPSVAGVNEDSGIVTGVSEGVTTVTASAGGHSGNAIVTVNDANPDLCRVQSQIAEVECQALVALYDSTNGPEWKASTDWLATATPCSWYGVTCTSGSVTHLRLTMNQLTGPIPSQLGYLSNLEWLQLANNQLTGTIPPELGNLGNLHSLVLGSNQLGGTIPLEIWNLSSLSALSLHTNQLTGAIPSEVGGLSNLQYLALFDNQLTGAIPLETGNLPSLQYLYLQYNQLIGGIPPDLGNLANLRNLNLSDNQLTGGIPLELGSLSSLQGLVLYGNHLTGVIPPWLGNLANLRELHLFDNQLTGVIPSELGTLVKLEYLTLHTNQLSGAIPSELGDLVNLEILYLHTNQLSDAVPLAVAQLGGLIQNSGIDRCDFLPGNAGLFLPDTDDIRAADLDADGLICEVAVPPGGFPDP